MVGIRRQATLRLRAKFKDMPDFVKGMDAVAKEFTNGKAGEKIGDAVKEEIIRNIKAVPNYHSYPMNYGSHGALEQSIEIERRVSPGDNLTVIAHIDVPYAGILEDGREGFNRWRGQKPYVFRGKTVNEVLVNRINRRVEYILQKKNRLRSIGMKPRQLIGYNKEGERVADPEALEQAREKVSTLTLLRSKYGLYTVITRKLKPIEPYHVYSKSLKSAADRAKGIIGREMRKALRKRFAAKKIKVKEVF